MVSRRNFLSMLLMMAVILFMFQTPEVIKENQSEYDTNSYADEEVLLGADVWTQEDGGLDDVVPYEDGDFVVFFGDTGSDTGHTVEQWCVYTKRNLLTFGSFDDYAISGDCLPEAVLIDSEAVDPIEGFSSLEEMTDYGMTLIFCNLPEPATLQQNGDFLDMLGIGSIREEEIEAEGVHLFGDLFLGGEAFYIVDEDDEKKLEKELKRQDMELRVPWYIMQRGTETYMVATLDELLKDEEDKNELFPSLIWRNAYQGAQVFAVVGDYLKGIAGIGILDGMIYEASAYSLYPVVNAQNVTVLNFPILAGENDEKAMELYSRNSESVLRDICWPTLSALQGRSRQKLTCFSAAQFDYTDDAESSGSGLPFYLQQYKEVTSEAGVSLDRTDETDISDKFARDEEFFGGLDSSYIFGAAYVRSEDLEQVSELLPTSKVFAGIKTLVSEYQDKEAVVSYYGSNMTRQNITADASFHTYSDNMKMRSLETALGYSNVLLDMYVVVWPKSEEDQWEKMSEEAVSNLETQWKPYKAFEKTTLTESDERIRTFLHLDYQQKREDDTIYLDISGTDGGWFILRTHGEKIDRIEGGTFVEIEQDAYLINAEMQKVEIQLGRSRGLMRYIFD